MATGYGQPPSTFYDWTLEPSGAIVDPGFELPKAARNRLLIERFSSRVTEALYRNHSDPVGLASDDNRSTFVKMLSRDYEDVEARVQQPDSCKSALACVLPVTPIWPHKGVSQFDHSDYCVLA